MKVSLDRVAILGGRGYVRRFLGKDIDELLNEVGENTGNLVFQRAASILVDDEQLFVGPGADIHSDLSRLHSECKAVIFPAANHIDLRNDLRALSRWLSGMNRPVVVLGIGTQASDSSAASLEQLVSKFALDEGFRELMITFRSANVFVGVRGTFTQSLLNRFDVPAVVTGCPSFLMNSNVTLGKLIERRFARIKAHLAEERDFNLAVTSISPWADEPEMAIECRLITWLHDRGGIYVQQSGGVNAMRLATRRFASSQELANVVAWYRGRLGAGLSTVAFDRLISEDMTTFFSVDAWRDALATCDLSLGTRYHGNALAMQCGVPSITVIHDSRTEELCESTAMPSVSKVRVMECKGLPELVDGINFDGSNYDKQRRKCARIVHDALMRFGVQPAAHLKNLSESHETNAFNLTS